MTRRRTTRIAVGVVVIAVVAAVLFARGWGITLIRRSAPATPYLVKDTSLKRDYIYFYPARLDSGTSPRAIVVFLGNDVGFWDPHKDLAERLADAHYSVVGLDIRGYLATLPESHPAREEAFAREAPELIARVRTELHGDSLPVVLGGHSFGAELAFWLAANKPPRGLTGLLAMSPRGSGHFVVTPADLANEEPAGVGAYSTITAASRIASNVRIAIVRGSKDQFAVHDRDFERAGGSRLQVFRVPLAAHSLKKLLLAGPIIEHAMDWMLQSSAASR